MNAGAGVKVAGLALLTKQVSRSNSWAAGFGVWAGLVACTELQHFQQMLLTDHSSPVILI